MNGAGSLLRTLTGAGVDVCFANPGTSEMHFVAALDRLGLVYCVLALQENVATGAADGYARMTGTPAANRVDRVNLRIMGILRGEGGHGSWSGPCPGRPLLSSAGSPVVG